MRYICYNDKDEKIAAVLSPDGKKALSFEEAGIPYKDLISMIRAGFTPEKIDFTYGRDADGLTLTSPVPYPEQDIICLGINYTEHAEESARYKKEAFERERAYPVYFSKRATETVGTGEDVCLHDDVTERVDYEAELAFILARDAKNVSAEDAYGYVFGYTVFNDISARDVQTRHKQWYFGKSLDGFAAMGPCVVSADEIADAENLPIRSYVNGQLRQNSNTALMVFDIPRVISELSSAMTLKAGTIISMGTPAGVGMGFDPPKFLKHNDVVVCEIDGIGRLENRFFSKK